MTTSRRRRFAIRGAIAGLAAALVLAGSGWLLVSTEAGARMALRLARSRLPEGVTIGAARGRLRGPLTFTDIEYLSETASVRIDTTVVDWRLFGLLRHRIDLVELQLAGVAVTVNTPEENEEPAEPTPPPDFRPSYEMQLGRAVVRRLAVTVPGADSSYSADSIVVGESEFTDRLRLSRVELSSPAAHATLALLVETSGNYPVDGSFTWSATMRGYSLAGSGTARGNLDSLDLTHHLTAPADLRLQATVRDVLGTLSFGASLSAAEFATGDIDSTFPAASVSGGFTAAGTPGLFTTDGTLEVTEERLGRIDASLRATVEDTVIRLDTMQLRFPGRRGQITVGGALRRGTGTVAGEAGVAWRGVTWPLTGPPRLSSSGRGQVRFNGADVVFDLVTTLAGAGVPTGQIRLHGAGNQQQLRVAAAGEALGGPVSADGTISWQPEVSWRARIEASGLDLAPLVEDSSLAPRNMAFRGTTEGRLVADSFVAAFTVDSIGATVRGLPVVAAGSGNLGPSGLTLDTAVVHLLEGVVGVAGDVAWMPAMAWRFTLDARDIRPAPLFPVPEEWPGALSVRAATTGRLTAGHPEVAVTVDEINGGLRGEPVAGRADVGYRGGVLRVPEASLDWGSLRFDASGELGNEISGRISLRVPDFAASLPEAGGSLLIEASFAGSRTAPTVTANLTGDTLRFRDIHMREIRAIADLDFAPGGSFGVSLRGSDLLADERSLQNASLDLEGTREEHDFVIQATGTEVELDIGGSGNLDSDSGSWRARVTRLALRDRNGTRNLREPAPLEVSRNHLALGNLCLDGTGRLCATGAWVRNGPWTATLDATGLALAEVASFAAPDLDIAGPLDLVGTVRADSSGNLEGNIAVLLGPGEIGYLARAQARRLVFDSSTAHARVGPAGLEVDWATSLRTPEGDSIPTRVDGTLALPDFHRLTDSLPPQRITGRLNAVIDDFSALEALMPNLVDPAGELRLEVNVDGTVENPRLLGNGQLRRVRGDVPLLGLELRDGSLDLTGDDTGVTIAGQIVSGAGVLAVSGRSNGLLAADTMLTLQLSGANLQAVATSEVQLRASPDLAVNAGRSWLSVEGDIIIPWAVIELREIPAVAVPVSPDVVYPGDSTAAGADEINLSTRVRVVLGDSVSFRGFGFTVQPRGSVLVIDQPGQLTTGSGQLSLDGGRYRAYGQDLTIESGRVIFAGAAIDNPGLDVRAVRRARDSTVAGLLIRGTLREPEVSIFSEPPMLQSDALAYLLIGRPLVEASSSEGSLVTGAARSLGLRGGNLLAQRIGTRFGLDDLRIEAEDSWQRASFMAGKYLSPRLYVAYSLGLFDSSGLLRVRYLLSSKWTLQAETGEGTATDIFYRIERGR